MALNKKWFCPHCKHELFNYGILRDYVHILDRCPFCEQKPMWDRNGKFLGECVAGRKE